MLSPFDRTEELFLGIMLDSKYNGKKFRNKTNLILAVDISASMNEKI